MNQFIDVPDDFNFETAVTGHGWYRLAPFHYDTREKRLKRIEELTSGRVVNFAISETDSPEIMITLEEDDLTEQENTEFLQKVRWMLRLDEDFQPFYDRCLQNRDMAYVAREKHGRLLRSPTLFEDFVKVLLTTNTTWNRTISMAAALVEKLGKPHPAHAELKTFPKPSAIVEKGITFLKEELRLGYRSDYIYDLALKVMQNEIDLEGMIERSTEDVVKQLKSIKGVGPYAQSTLLMILGHYDLLPVDSEFRKHVRTRYFAGKDPSPKEIATLYKDWGHFKYLAYWFDRKA